MLTNWHNPGPHIAAAPVDQCGHEIKTVLNWKKMLPKQEYQEDTCKDYQMRAIIILLSCLKDPG